MALSGERGRFEMAHSLISGFRMANRQERLPSDAALPTDKTGLRGDKGEVSFAALAEQGLGHLGSHQTA